jgi:hypothetical protein
MDDGGAVSCMMSGAGFLMRAGFGGGNGFGRGSTRFGTVYKLDMVTIVAVPPGVKPAVTGSAGKPCAIIGSPCMSSAWSRQSWRKPVPERSTGSGSRTPM